MTRMSRVRRELQIKQDDLANEMHVTRSMISKYETGKVPMTDEQLAFVSKRLNVSADYLLGTTDDPTPVNQLKLQLKAAEAKSAATQPMLLIPNILREIRVAFDGGDEGLTQPEIDELAKFAEYLKSKRRL